MSSSLDFGFVSLFMCSGMEMLLSALTLGQACRCFNNAVACKNVSLAVDCVSLVSSDLELEGCWEQLLGSLYEGELGTDTGNRLSASS